MLSFWKDEHTGATTITFLAGFKAKLVNLTRNFGFNEPRAKRSKKPDQNFDLIC